MIFFFLHFKWREIINLNVSIKNTKKMSFDVKVIVLCNVISNKANMIKMNVFMTTV